MELPGVAVLEHLGSRSQSLIFGSIEGLMCEIRLWPDGSAVSAALKKGNYRQLWGHWPQSYLEALCRARGLVSWLNQNRFCGVCGNAMEACTIEPARRCPVCGFKAYPRISPICIGLVLKGRELLLARSSHFPPGVYSALAGYIEAGESVEDCLCREIREEAGIEIRNIRWFGSQAWPYPCSLMMGFFAEYAGGVLVAQEREIESIGWFAPEKLPLLPHPSTIAFQMIDSACHHLLSR